MGRVCVVARQRGRGKEPCRDGRRDNAICGAVREIRGEPITRGCSRWRWDECAQRKGYTRARVVFSASCA